MKKQTRLHISGMNKMDLLSLQSKLGREIVVLEDCPAEEGNFGEPATVAIVIVSIQAVVTLAAIWGGSRSRRKIDYGVDIEYPDGRRESRRLSMDISDRKQIEPELLKSLADVLPKANGASGNVT